MSRGAGNGNSSVGLASSRRTSVSQRVPGTASRLRFRRARSQKLCGKCLMNLLFEAWYIIFQSMNVECSPKSMIADRLFPLVTKYLNDLEAPWTKAKLRLKIGTAFTNRRQGRLKAEVLQFHPLELCLWRVTCTKKWRHCVPWRCVHTSAKHRQCTQHPCMWYRV